MYIKTAPINGKVPKIRLRVLYLPVVCIIHPAKSEPIDIERLFGNRWRPRKSILFLVLKKTVRKVFLIPAMDALVNMTVWNHIGKKYKIEKLHIATRKLDIPTKIGIFCLRRDGARTGSGATKFSTRRKRMANMLARVMDTITAGFDHFNWIEVSKELICCWRLLTGRLSL